MESAIHPAALLLWGPLRLIPGPNLATLMHERTLDAAHTLRYSDRSAPPSTRAHAAGLVHRDVKPHNVLVGDSDDAYLGDFGLTRMGGRPASRDWDHGLNDAVSKTVGGVGSLVGSNPTPSVTCRCASRSLAA